MTYLWRRKKKQRTHLQRKTQWKEQVNKTKSIQEIITVEDNENADVLEMIDEKDGELEIQIPTRELQKN